MFVHRKFGFALSLSICALFTLSSCGSDDSDDGGTTDNTDTNSVNDISTIMDKFYTSNTTVSVGEEFITISSDNLPDHKSLYYEKSNSLYEDYDEPDNDDFKANPNSIVEQDIVYNIPRYPSEASTHESTKGSHGVAVNGVIFFNQFAAPGDDIFEELNTFDQYEGHPQNSGIYHYHLEPTWLTSTLGSDQIVGVLIDGFPVYGNMEDGKEVTNADLDDYHGHSHATAEFPNGIYHYHITDEYPWINGDGYYGTPGTITQ